MPKTAPIITITPEMIEVAEAAYWAASKEVGQGQTIAPLLEAVLAATNPIVAEQTLTNEAASWDAAYEIPMKKHCSVCGAKPGQNCFGSKKGPLPQAHSQRRGDRITPTSLRARAVEIRRTVPASHNS